MNKQNTGEDRLEEIRKKAIEKNNIESNIREIWREFVGELKLSDYDSQDWAEELVKDSAEYIQKNFTANSEIEKALEDDICIACRDDTQLSHKGSNFIGNCPIDEANETKAEIRKKLGLDK